MNKYLVKNGISERIKKEVLVNLFAMDVNIDELLDEFKKWQGKCYYKYKDITEVSEKFLLQNAENKDKIRCAGLDLPSWFGNFNGERKKIILYGINPIRAKNDWTTAGSEFKTVAIGTAWASHQKKDFVDKDKKYWPLIKELITDFDIYLTDIHKLYYLNSEGKQSQKTGFNDISFHQELIEKELNIIKPDLVITIGFQAYTLLTGEAINASKFELKPWKNTKIAAFPHLSGSVRTPFRKKYLELNENTKLNEYSGKGFVNLIKNYFINTP